MNCKYLYLLVRLIDFTLSTTFLFLFWISPIFMYIAIQCWLTLNYAKLPDVKVTMR